MYFLLDKVTKKDVLGSCFKSITNLLFSFSLGTASSMSEHYIIAQLINHSNDTAIFRAKNKMLDRRCTVPAGETKAFKASFVDEKSLDKHDFEAYSPSYKRLYLNDKSSVSLKPSPFYHITKVEISNGGMYFCSLNFEGWTKRLF